MNVVEVKNLTLAYDGKPVVNNLSFAAQKGEYICVVGENGSGKSTFIKALVGAVKPVSGSIKFKKQSKIGYLSQQTEAQKDFPASVMEVVMSGFAYKIGFLPTVNRSLRQKADEYMQLLGVDKLKDKCYRELSGGQQQKVLLTRAFCSAGDILLLDEPVTGLDKDSIGEFYSVISDLNKKGVSVIMVTHDLAIAMHMSDKILDLSHNSFFFGTPKEYLNFKSSKDGAK